MAEKTLLIVGHVPSPNTQALRDAVEAGALSDGVESIVTGLRWKAVRDPLLLHGEWQDGFVDEARELGLLVAAGLEAGVF
jgi:hypothetical protein